MKFDKCPCGSGVDFEACCGGIIAGLRTACIAEELMRSRYTAYVLKKVDYLVQTTHPSSRTADLPDSIRKWMRQVEWLKLHIVATAEGGEADLTGRVEFIAEYLSDSGPGRHHECSVFEKVDNDWYYVGEECE
ncbi:MAG: YchJ family metal-binding protein [Pseudomonadota bacterium]